MLITLLSRNYPDTYRSIEQVAITIDVQSESEEGWYGINTQYPQSGVQFYPAYAWQQIVIPHG
jgi:hypothetical protein